MTAPDDLAPRIVALDCLEAVLGRRQPFDQAFETLPGLDNLEPRDRAFVRMLTATALRHCGTIDALILGFSAQGRLPALPVLNVLRLGLTQLLHMDVPDYAAVDTSVRLAAARGQGRQGGFINALLRRAIREKDAAPVDPLLDLPDWLRQTWVEDYGATATAAIATASLREAPLDLSLRDPQSAPEWVERLSAVSLPGGGLRLEAGGRIESLPGFDDGAWWVQDAAAALPARLFGDVANRTVIDLCAAPGGKTAQLAAMGATVIALDRSTKRLERLRDNIARLNLSDRVTPLTADAEVWTPDMPADFILLDAPCTATGTIRRNPDVLHLKSPDDMRKLCALQARLLDRAAGMLAPGGTLIYCTCSLQKDEGERQVDAFLTRAPGFVRLPIRKDEIGDLADAVTPEGDVRLLPSMLPELGGIDGFFIARLRRAA